MKRLIALGAASLMGSTAYAADLIISNTEPVFVDPVVYASPSGFRGSAEIGLQGAYVVNNDDGVEELMGGAYVSAAVSGAADGFVWGLDGLLDGLWVDPSDALQYTGVAGLHVGLGDFDNSVGLFGSAGLTADRAGDANFGYTVGVEGIADLGAFSLFGQVGYADVETDSSGAGFKGGFIRGGAIVALSDDLAVMSEAAYGHTAHFEDPNDEGYFVSAGVKAAFALPTDFAAFVTLGYEASYFEATTEAAYGLTHTARIGLSIPFGDDATAASALRPLATSPLPYRAAGWADILD